MNDCSTIIQPLAQTNTAAPSVLPGINYTNQDFASLKTRLALYVEQRFPNDFSDFAEADLGIMLMEMWAFCADMLSFKMDQQANENYIDSVTELENAFRICKQVGFKPTPPIAARALFTATINTILQADMTIPSGFLLQTNGESGNISYELYPADSLNNPIFDQDIIIPAGNFQTSSIVGLEGRTVQETFVSTGSINQVFTLSQTSILFNSSQVTVDGTLWTAVDYFTNQTLQEYRIEFDSNYRASIIFGNGQAGFVPSQGSQIIVSYRVGGGSNGNIITGAINTQFGFIVTGFNISVPVTFTNYTRGEFGYDGDTIEDIRRKLPAYNQSQNRAVTGADYKNLADLFVSTYNGQIGKSTAVLRNYGCAGNVIDLFVLARDGTDGLEQANDQLKVELQEYMDDQKMITDYLCVKDGEIVSVDVVIDLNVPKFYSKFSEEIKQKALIRANNFFALTNWEYGKDLVDTELIQALADIKEVKSVDISFTTNDPDQSGDTIIVQYYEIIRPDVINVVLTFE